MVEDIRNFSVAELEARFKTQGMEPYRARQVFGWLYQKKVEDFSLMKNLSGDVLEKLDRFYTIDKPVVEKILTSRDLTQKFLFRLNDGAVIEGVSIPFKSRLTACLSTQVGCKFSCAFCASGSAGFQRSLTTGEIVGQLVTVMCLREKYRTWFLWGWANLWIITIICWPRSGSSIILWASIWVSAK
jgi:23S rRNA (adenine2503-C2)-methyltransferase